MTMTETMLEQIAIDARPLDSPWFKRPYKHLNFIPDIEAAAGFSLPDLSIPDAQAILEQSMTDRRIPIPSDRTLPKLLDKLCSLYLEPQCKEPTWICQQPECLSPLAKSFAHPSNKQLVAARAELFVDGKEIVNTYEEENSPYEQRRKFLKQQSYSTGISIEPDTETIQVDESYLAALEAGLPPTGGWGCGIDRLVMLMTGKKRIADTLSFGTLRNVVAVSKNKASLPEIVPDVGQFGTSSGVPSASEGSDHSGEVHGSPARGAESSVSPPDDIVPLEEERPPQNGIVHPVQGQQPQNGNIHSIQGQPFQYGIVHPVQRQPPQNGIIHPVQGQQLQNGIIHPVQWQPPQDGIIHPVQGQPPQNGIVHPARGQPPQNGIIHPVQGQSPQNGIVHPARGQPPQNGLMHPDDENSPRELIPDMGLTEGSSDRSGQ